MFIFNDKYYGEVLKIYFDVKKSVLFSTLLMGLGQSFDLTYYEINWYFL